MTSPEFAADGYLIWNGQRWTHVSYLGGMDSRATAAAAALLPALGLSAVLTMPTWLPPVMEAFKQLFGR